MAYLQAPTVGACNYVGANNHGKGTAYFNPGVYCGQIKLDSNNNAVFNPGLYILEGGIKQTANINVSGTGVTFYNTGTAQYPYGAIDLAGSGQTTLSAPTSGTYEGILFFQDRSVAAGSAGSTVTGGSGSTFDGAMYFSTTALSYGGNSSTDGYTIVVAYSISVSGSSTFGDNYSSLADGDPIKSTALYE